MSNPYDTKLDYDLLKRSPGSQSYSASLLKVSEFTDELDNLNNFLSPNFDLNLDDTDDIDTEIAEREAYSRLSRTENSLLYTESKLAIENKTDDYKYLDDYKAIDYKPNNESNNESNHKSNHKSNYESNYRSNSKTNIKTEKIDSFSFSSNPYQHQQHQQNQQKQQNQYNNVFDRKPIKEERLDKIDDLFGVGEAIKEFESNREKEFSFKFSSNFENVSKNCDFNSKDRSLDDDLEDKYDPFAVQSDQYSDEEIEPKNEETNSSIKFQSDQSFKPVKFGFDQKNYYVDHNETRESGELDSDHDDDVKNESNFNSSKINDSKINVFSFAKQTFSNEKSLFDRQQSFNKPFNQPQFSSNPPSSTNIKFSFDPNTCWNQEIKTVSKQPDDHFFYRTILDQAKNQNKIVTTQLDDRTAEKLLKNENQIYLNFSKRPIEFDRLNCVNNLSNHLGSEDSQTIENLSHYRQILKPSHKDRSKRVNCGTKSLNESIFGNPDDKLEVDEGSELFKPEVFGDFSYDDFNESGK